MAQMMHLHRLGIVVIVVCLIDMASRHCVSWLK